MDEQEKKEIIQAINEIRKELNLEPYPFEQLEARNVEELKKLYSIYFQMREYQRKKLEEEKVRFKLSLKNMLLIGVPILIFIIFSSFFFSLPKKISPSELPPLSPKEEFSINKSEAMQTYADFVIEYSFKGPENRYILVLKNNGLANLTISSIIIDSEYINFEIVSGNFPIQPQNSVYLKLFKECDNSSHLIKVKSTENKTLEATLQPC